MDSGCLQLSGEIIRSLVFRYPDISVCETDIRDAVRLLVEVFQNGHKLLVCGNGGSAADSEHVVGELMKSFRFKRPTDGVFKKAYQDVNGEEAPSWLEGALPAISLVSHTAFSTAFCNDTVALGAFAQQVYGYGEKGDALLAISTSGNSANVIEAAKVARAKGVSVVSLTGSGASKLALLSDVCVRVPREEVFLVQELHLPIYHCLCACVEAELFGGSFE